MSLPPPPEPSVPPQPSRLVVTALWGLCLVGLQAGAVRLSWIRSKPSPQGGSPVLRSVQVSLIEVPVLQPEPPPERFGAPGGSHRDGSGSRDPELPADPIRLGVPPPQPALEALPGRGLLQDLPLGPADVGLPLQAGGNGLPRGTGQGLGRGEGSGTGSGRGNGTRPAAPPKPPQPTLVDLSDLTLRTSAVPVHTVKEDETFADNRVVLRLVFGGDGLPTRWDPIYGDPRLIPDALRAARVYTFKVPPRLQAQAPLQVRLTFRFRHLATTTQAPLMPGGVPARIFEASAFECLQAVAPSFQPRPGELFLDPRVVVRLFLRENGVPFEAEAVSGDPRLMPSARKAALAHRYRVPPDLKRHAPLALILSFTYADLPG